MKGLERIVDENYFKEIHKLVTLAQAEKWYRSIVPLSPLRGTERSPSNGARSYKRKS